MIHLNNCMCEKCKEEDMRFIKKIKSITKKERSILRKEIKSDMEFYKKLLPNKIERKGGKKYV